MIYDDSIYLVAMISAQAQVRVALNGQQHQGSNKQRKHWAWSWLNLKGWGKDSRDGFAYLTAILNVVAEEDNDTEAVASECQSHCFHSVFNDIAQGAPHCSSSSAAMLLLPSNLVGGRVGTCTTPVISSHDDQCCWWSVALAGLPLPRPYIRWTQGLSLTWKGTEKEQAKLNALESSCWRQRRRHSVFVPKWCRCRLASLSLKVHVPHRTTTSSHCHRMERRQAVKHSLCLGATYDVSDVMATVRRSHSPSLDSSESHAPTKDTHPLAFHLKTPPFWGYYRQQHFWSLADRLLAEVLSVSIDFAGCMLQPSNIAAEQKGFPLVAVWRWRGRKEWKRRGW